MSRRDLSTRQMPSGCFTPSYRDDAVASGWMRLDEGLVAGVLRLMGWQGSVCDFGAFVGRYVEAFRRAGVEADGFDGTPGAAQVSGWMVGEADLSVPQSFSRKWDWILCTEVGEHIPIDRQEAFLGNIARHCRVGAVVSWAWPTKPGRLHVNAKTDAELTGAMRSVRLVRDWKWTEIIRPCCRERAYRQRLGVFRLSRRR